MQGAVRCIRATAFAALLAAASCDRDAPPPAPAAAPTVPERLRAFAADADADGFVGEANARRARHAAAALTPASTGDDWFVAFTTLAEEELRLGRTDAAVKAFNDVIALLSAPESSRAQLPAIFVRRGIAQLRKGELENCCARYTPESCVMPIRGAGLHSKPAGSQAAIASFTEALKIAAPGSDEHWSARWLLNIAHMTLGTWPGEVPAAWRLEPRALGDASGFPRYENVASFAGMADVNLSGGSAAEDFDGDGRIDLVLSDWHPTRRLRFFKNRGDGAFEERGVAAGLEGALGGLNLVVNDYDGDGDPDLLVTRGGWLGPRGRQPVSLLKNEGGVFTDVTDVAGLADAIGPSQTAAFADYDGDGDVDFYLGVEATSPSEATGRSRLFRNDGGRFVDVATAAGVTNGRFAKGVAWGDYDGDGDPDLYVSNYEGDNRLYRNQGDGKFVDVAPELGVTKPKDGFPCWFFDADQDGALDVFAGAFFKEVAPTAAAYFGKPDPARYSRIYRGDGKGGFVDVTEAWGATRVVPVMGSGFGDLNNDGAPEAYLGTGAPDYGVLTPNVMYLNGEKDGVRRFKDVTVAGGFGILQKGHGVSFADFDGDGDQDVFTVTGGAYGEDGFRNALYENPGAAGGRLWIRLRGVKANGAGYGARVRAEVEKGGVVRNVYAFVGCQPSFGGNPLGAWLGLGGADKVRLVEIKWPKPSESVQIVNDVPLGAAFEVVEGKDGRRVLDVPRSTFRRG
jgi:hypothetical protein